MHSPQRCVRCHKRSLVGLKPTRLSHPLQELLCPLVGGMSKKLCWACALQNLALV